MRNKTVFITGGSGGIGSAVIEKFLKEDYNVVACASRSSSKTVQLNKKFQSLSSTRFRFIYGDLTSQASIQLFCDQIPQPIIAQTRIIIHAASIPVGYSSVTQTNWDLIEKNFNINLGGLFFLVQKFLPSLQKAKFGRIIAIGSALTHNVPPNKLFHYITAKAALSAGCKSLAVELAPYGITVNCIAPGVTDTSFLDTFPPQMRELAVSKIPLRRIAQPSEIAKVIFDLCAEDSGYVTGVEIPVAGGMVM